jgi:hypothetical protein
MLGSLSWKMVSVLDLCCETTNARLELQKEEKRRDAITIPDENIVATYYDYRQQLDRMAADFREVITHPNYSLPFLQPGRLIKVKYKDLDFGWGVVVNYQKRLPPKVIILVKQLNQRLILLLDVARTSTSGCPSSRAICSRCAIELQRGRYSSERQVDIHTHTRRDTPLWPWQ